VTELDAKARAKGLLRADQSITNVKAFRSAKKTLDIRSLLEISGVPGRPVSHTASTGVAQGVAAQPEGCGTSTGGLLSSPQGGEEEGRLR
jgi:hypothetical protein